MVLKALEIVRGFFLDQGTMVLEHDMLEPKWPRIVLVTLMLFNYCVGGLFVVLLLVLS